MLREFQPSDAGALLPRLAICMPGIRLISFKRTIRLLSGFPGLVNRNGVDTMITASFLNPISLFSTKLICLTAISVAMVNTWAIRNWEIVRLFLNKAFLLVAVPL